jgi:hypothetical protein
MAKQTKEKVFNFGLLLNRAITLLLKVKWILYILTLALVVTVINRFFFNSGMINHELILDYIDSLEIIIIVVLIAFIAKYYFPDLTERAKKIGPGGAEFYEKQQQDQIEDEDTLEDISNTSSGANFDISTEGGRQQILQEEFQAKWLLERIYRIIFGTQIELLLKLQSFPNGLSEGDLQEIYAKHRAATAQPHPTFLDFIAYLSNHSLVDYNAKTKLVKLTDAGRLFLDYLAQENIANPLLKRL